MKEPLLSIVFTSASIAIVETFGLPALLCFWLGYMLAPTRKP